MILDALIPPIKKTAASGFAMTDDEDLNEKTRERFREKLQNGELEDKKIEISVQQSQTQGIGIAGPGMDEMTMMNIQEMIGGMMPKKAKNEKWASPKPAEYW